MMGMATEEGLQLLVPSFFLFLVPWGNAAGRRHHVSAPYAYLQDCRGADALCQLSASESGAYQLNRQRRPLFCQRGKHGAVPFQSAIDVISICLPLHFYGTPVRHG